MEISAFTHILFDIDHTLWDFERNFRGCEISGYFDDCLIAEPHGSVALRDQT